MLSSAIKVIPDDMIYPSMEDTDIWENQASEGIHPIKGLNDYLDGFPGKIEVQCSHKPIVSSYPFLYRNTDSDGSKPL